MRSLGNIEFVGELYKRKLLDMKIMHRCIRDLLAVGARFGFSVLNPAPPPFPSLSGPHL